MYIVLIRCHVPPPRKIDVPQEYHIISLFPLYFYDFVSSSHPLHVRILTLFGPSAEIISRPNVFICRVVRFFLAEGKQSLYIYCLNGSSGV